MGFLDIFQKKTYCPKADEFFPAIKQYLKSVLSQEKSDGANCCFQVNFPVLLLHLLYCMILPDESDPPYRHQELSHL